MIQNLKASFEQSEDGKVYVRFVNEVIAPCIRTMEYDGKQLELMSYQLVAAFLTTVGIEIANLSTTEAYRLAHNTILLYKPAFVTEEDVKKNYHYCAYTRPEFNLLYHYYLVVYCRVDPLEAFKAKDDDTFWHHFFPNAKSYDPSLPKLCGNFNDIERAKGIQRRQVEDLRILKEGIDNWVGPIIRKMIEEAADKDKADSISLGYNIMKEALIVYIDSIIQRPRAEDWLSTDDLFKYTSKWLNKIDKRMSDEIEYWKAEINYEAPECRLRYPVLYCSGWAAIEVDLQSTNWQVRIVNHKLKHILVRKLAGEIEVVERMLVMFFLMSLGVKVAELQANKACKFAEKATDLWNRKLKLKIVQAYTRNELVDVSQYYLEECCSCFLPKRLILEYADEFWRMFFPDTGPFYDFLPKLVGEAGEIAQAELIRSRQVDDLLMLLNAFEADKQSNNVVAKENKLLSSSDFGLTGHINEIINRNQARDWLVTYSTTYDLMWLRHEMDSIIL